MKHLHRSILLEMTSTFLMSVLFFNFVFLMFQIVRLADYFINHGVGILLLLKLTVYVSAAFVPVVIPISFLMAVLGTFGRMSTDSEIVAAKAAGYSLQQISLPVFITSFLVVGSIALLSFFFIPHTNLEFRQTVIKLANTKVVSHIQEGTFTEGFFDLLVYADKVDSDKSELKGVFIFDERDPHHPSIVVAEHGLMTTFKNHSRLGSATELTLFDGSIHRPPLSGDLNSKDALTYEKIDYKKYRLNLEVEEGLGEEVRFPKTRSQIRLYRDMKDYLAQGDLEHYRESAYEFWKRIGLALAGFLFAFFGIGLGTARSRQTRTNPLVVGTGLIIFYWILYLVGISLSEKGWFPPWIGVQMANLLMIPVAFYSYRKASW